jgi:heat-inducible transcriptional repressor
MINELNERAQSILRTIIDSYMATGEPVGSRTLAQALNLDLSAATIRNVMSDLENIGLLYSPHTSAGRMPTQQGLRLYVDGLMQVGSLTSDEQKLIDMECGEHNLSMTQLLERTTSTLSGLSSCAGLVIAPKTDKPVKHIQFIKLEAQRILIVLVTNDGMVENRVMETEEDIPDFALISAANYLNSKIQGRTLTEAQSGIFKEIEEKRAQLDNLTASLVKQGLALPPQDTNDGHIIVRGQSNLLQDVKAIEDLEKARNLLAALEENQTIMNLLQETDGAEGVQIYIGSENRIFDSSGWSMVLSPYRTEQKKIVGAIGVIGPTRLNYSRIIPLVDYTSKVMEKLLNR